MDSVEGHIYDDSSNQLFDDYIDAYNELAERLDEITIQLLDKTVEKHRLFIEKVIHFKSLRCHT